jgi:arginase/N-omega-hydroxy-L-arginine amidinohydrolase
MHTIRKVIAFQGRAGERAEGSIPGAARLANAIANSWRIPLEFVGAPSPIRTDQWDEALELARPQLHALRNAIAVERTSGSVPFCVLPTDGATLPVLPAAIAGDSDVSLIWFDAHADFNTPETTTSGYLGGMALAGACGLWTTGFGAALNSDQVVLIGVRSIDDEEAKLVRQHGLIKVAADRRVLTVLEALQLRPRAYIHLDLDCLDPGLIPLQYNEPSGLLLNEVRDCVEQIGNRCQLVGVSVSEFYDPKDSPASEAHLASVVALLSGIERQLCAAKAWLRASASRQIT